MSALEVIAKPVFSKSDADWLMHAREEYAHSAGPAEFTLVFPGPQFSVGDVVAHVQATCAVMPPIKFCLRSAVIVPDLGPSAFHVFLVPDEGFGAIIRLHDKLHVGPLAECLRPEVPYIPHLTVASVRDFGTARRIKAKLNSFDLEIDGRIEALEVHKRDTAEITLVATAPLRHRSYFA